MLDRSRAAAHAEPSPAAARAAIRPERTAPAAADPVSVLLVHPAEVSPPRELHAFVAEERALHVDQRPVELAQAHLARVHVPGKGLVLLFQGQLQRLPMAEDVAVDLLDRDFVLDEPDFLAGDSCSSA
jgi:hypothetical protein